MVSPTMLQLVLLALASSLNEKMGSTALAQQIKEGDHRAFQHFFDTHYDSLLRFLMSKNTAPEAAKDLIQKAFIYIWEHRSKIDPDQSLRAYIFRIAYTRMLNHHRDTKKFNDETAVPEQETTLTPEDAIRGRDLEQAIKRSIDRLPEKRGAVFQLCFIEDFTYKEAAQTLDVSKKTIENHMGLALKDMREALREFQ